MMVPHRPKRQRPPTGQGYSSPSSPSPSSSFCLPPRLPTPSRHPVPLLHQQLLLAFLLLLLSICVLVPSVSATPEDLGGEGDSVVGVPEIQAARRGLTSLLHCSWSTGRSPSPSFRVRWFGLSAAREVLVTEALVRSSRNESQLMHNLLLLPEALPPGTQVLCEVQATASENTVTSPPYYLGLVLSLHDGEPHKDHRSPFLRGIGHSGGRGDGAPGSRSSQEEFLRELGQMNETFLRARRIVHRESESSAGRQVRVVAEGGRVRLSIRSTIPLVCATGHPCPLALDVIVKAVGKSQEMYTSSVCRVVLQPSSCDALGCAHTEVVLPAPPDQRSGSLRLFTISAEPREAVREWSKYAAQSVVVKVRDEPWRLCAVAGRGHVLALDGARFTLLPFNASGSSSADDDADGEVSVFLLHKSTEVEVQVGLRRCHDGWGLCVCGWGARLLRHHIVLDGCDNDEPHIVLIPLAGGEPRRSRLPGGPHPQVRSSHGGVMITVVGHSVGIRTRRVPWGVTLSLMLPPSLHPRARPRRRPGLCGLLEPPAPHLKLTYETSLLRLTPKNPGDRKERDASCCSLVSDRAGDALLEADSRTCVGPSPSHFMTLFDFVDVTPEALAEERRRETKNESPSPRNTSSSSDQDKLPDQGNKRDGATEVEEPGDASSRAGRGDVDDSDRQMGTRRSPPVLQRSGARERNPLKKNRWSQRRSWMLRKRFDRYLSSHNVSMTHDNIDYSRSHYEVEDGTRQKPSGAKEARDPADGGSDSTKTFTVDLGQHEIIRTSRSLEDDLELMDDSPFENLLDSPFEMSLLPHRGGYPSATYIDILNAQNDKNASTASRTGPKVLDRSTLPRNRGTPHPEEPQTFSYKDHRKEAQADCEAWPADLTGSTEEDLRVWCARVLLTSPVAVECGAFLSSSVDAAVELCVLDTRWRTRLAWWGAGLGVMQDECEMGVLARHDANRAPAAIRQALNHPTTSPTPLPTATEHRVFLMAHENRKLTYDLHDALGVPSAPSATPSASDDEGADRGPPLPKLTFEQTTGAALDDANVSKEGIFTWNWPQLQGALNASTFTFTARNGCGRGVATIVLEVGVLPCTCPCASPGDSPRSDPWSRPRFGHLPGPVAINPDAASASAVLCAEADPKCRYCRPACPAGTDGDGIHCYDVDDCASDPCPVGVACCDLPAPLRGFHCGSCNPPPTPTPSEDFRKPRPSPSEGGIPEDPVRKGEGLREDSASPSQKATEQGNSEGTFARRWYARRQKISQREYKKNPENETPETTVRDDMLTATDMTSYQHPERKASLGTPGLTSYQRSKTIDRLEEPDMTSYQQPSVKDPPEAPDMTSKSGEVFARRWYARRQKISQREYNNNPESETPETTVREDMLTATDMTSYQHPERKASPGTPDLTSYQRSKTKDPPEVPGLTPYQQTKKDDSPEAPDMTSYRQSETRDPPETPEMASYQYSMRKGSSGAPATSKTDTRPTQALPTVSSHDTNFSAASQMCQRSCVSGVCQGGRCRCGEGWRGEDCSIPVCTPECAPGATCSAPGVCTCRPSPRSTYCSSGHCRSATCSTSGGWCVDGRGCVCKRGWEGVACDTPRCGQGCLHGGTCVAPQRCACSPSWTGRRCQRPTCRSACAHGSCMRIGRCLCEEGWYGRKCDRKRRGTAPRGRTRTRTPGQRRNSRNRLNKHRTAPEQ